MKKEVRNEALKLRIEERKSYSEIQKILKVSKSTLSIWLSDYPLTEKEKQIKISKGYDKSRETKRKNKEARKKKWIKEANTFYEKHKNDPLFQLGLGLYWGEGFKTGSTLGVANSDYKLLSTWVAWHKKYLPGVNMFGKIQAHPDVDKEKAIEFWMSLGLDYCKLYRCEPVSSKNKRPKRLPHGTCQVITRKGSLEWHTKVLKCLELNANFLT